MKASDHLDKIFSLGFCIDIRWNDYIQISYNADDVFPNTSYIVDVLICRYFKSNDIEYSFEDMIIRCCDIFYQWYNDNIKFIREFDDHYDPKSLQKLEDSCLYDITKQVARDFGLDDILKIIGG
jgi:hypothetical protein